MMEELKKENSELKGAIEQLKIEKYRLEDQLYRAFRKCLNTKKRKIHQLQKELARLKGQVCGSSAGSSPAKGGRGGKQRRVVGIKPSSSEEDSDDTTVDSIIGYEEEVILDDDDTQIDRPSPPLLPSQIQVAVSPSSSSTTMDMDDVGVDEVTTTGAKSGVEEGETDGATSNKSPPSPQGDDDLDLDELTKDL